MIGRFLYGASVGGVMAALGLALASLVSQPQPTSALATVPAPATTSPADPAPDPLPDVAVAEPAETTAQTEPDPVTTEDSDLAENPDKTPEPAPAKADDAAPPPVLAEGAPALVPDQPAKPPAPLQDSGVVTKKPPAALPARPDDALIAEADPQPDPPQVPEISDPSPLLPTPEEPPAAPAIAEELPVVEPAADPVPAPAPEPDPAKKTGPTILPSLAGNDSPTLKPTPGLGQKTEGVIIGRLPRIGDTPATEAPADTSVNADIPLKSQAESFDNPEGKPIFAIVLIDTGEAALDREALAQLPFAISFALDPLDPAASQHAAIYRAAGQEVVMLATGIAEGSQASDIEVAFQTMSQGLPEAVAVMDLPSLGFQDNRPLASLVVPVVAAQGRGLLTWDKGLNAADQIARREDLAAAVIFRNLDGAGEDKAAIRRALDRAAFKAAQDGRVTVVGQTLPDTVAALLEWTVEGHASSVAIAPVSAVVSVQ